MTQSSPLIVHEGWRFRPFAEAEMAAPVPWFAAVQLIEREQDLCDLAPERCFIATEAVERVVRQIGKAQEARREVSGRTNGRFGRFGSPARASGDRNSRRSAAGMNRSDIGRWS